MSANPQPAAPIAVPSPPSPSPFLQAARGERPARDPVWIMRQAGRYLPEYRAVRARHPNFLDFCRHPEDACAVTLQPVDRIGVDAAILFSDILVLLPPMGLPLSFVEGKGPRVDRPVREEADIRALLGGDAATGHNGELGYVFEAIRLVKRALGGKVPLIGFAGGPFTVASYMVEGGSSKELTRLKSLLFGRPDLFRLLMEKIARITALYLEEQVRQGADAVTLMDSWAGYLGPEDYRREVLPFTRLIFDHLKKACPGTPFIHYANGASALVDDIVTLEIPVVGLDWRTDLASALARHPRQVFQGNLDPCYLYASPAKIRKEVEGLKRVLGKRPHLFNLGHGILPDIDPEHAKAFVDAVHELPRPE